ncbi:MAG TPA: hypothetical protein VHB73_08145 [Alphaproteobacteria bacterium]|nr:hypothetical protein [Alphaproteobacteria bacterium]
MAFNSSTNSAYNFANCILWQAKERLAFLLPSVGIAALISGAAPLVLLALMRWLAFIAEAFVRLLYPAPATQLRWCVGHAGEGIVICYSKSKSPAQLNAGAFIGCLCWLRSRLCEDDNF